MSSGNSAAPGRTPAPAMMMASWWRDLGRITDDQKSGGVVTGPEVRAAIAPHKAVLRSSPEYKKAVSDLAAGSGGARVTEGAAKELSKILGKDVAPGKTRVTFTPGVKSASYFPGLGYRPRPGGNHNATVKMTLQFPQSNANPEWRATVDNSKRVVTVYVKGTASQKIVHVMQPQPVDVSFSIARPKHIDATYTLRVVSAESPNRELFKTTFKNIRPL